MSIINVALILTDLLKKVQDLFVCSKRLLSSRHTVYTLYGIYISTCHHHSKLFMACFYFIVVKVVEIKKFTQLSLTERL